MIIAEAQTQPPGTDVYLNTNPAFSKLVQKKLTQSTILHEALHNLTGLEDPALMETLGTSPGPNGATDTINQVLVQNGCAGN